MTLEPKNNPNTNSVSNNSIPANLIQKIIQMEHELLSRGIPEEEVHRSIIAYFSEPEPPQAQNWPGPITGLDLADRINPNIVVDTGEPTTNLNGLPSDVQPYPTPNFSPYGIGSYPTAPTPDPNSINSQSNIYDMKNPSITPSSNWTGLASDVNSEPSMHGEEGYLGSSKIPPLPTDYESYDTQHMHSKGITPSGELNETTNNKTKNKYLQLLSKWSLLLGGATAVNNIVKNYIDSDDTKPLEILAEYQYTGHDNDDECAQFAGKNFNLIETHNRPVIPSEKLGYTTTHPNCKCNWKVQENYNLKKDKITKNQQEDIDRIEIHINDAAKKGELHKIKKDGKLDKKTTKKNPLKEIFITNFQMPEMPLDFISLQKNKKIKLNRHTIKEIKDSLRSEFNWLDDDYINGAKKITEDADGQLYLIRAAAESITDHRGEGEPYRRKLSGDELNSMTRTAIGKSMDINHQPEFKTDANILDAEYDTNRKEIQMLVIERDSTINKAINDGIITAVSINGGMPRSESLEQCNHNCSDSCELCIVPKGVVLGELDGIALTWVVTDPKGLYWDGHHINSAEPGVKITKIEKL